MTKLAMPLNGVDELREQLVAYEDAYALAEGLDPKTLDEDPVLPSVYEGLATVLLRMGRLGRAIAVVDRGLVHFPQALQLMFLRGDLARRVGDVLRAKSYLEACLGRTSSSLLCSIGRGLADARPLVALARVALDAGDFRLAAERIARASRHEPNALDIRCLQVLVLQRQSSRAAMQALHRLLDDAPVDPEVQLLGGELAWQARSHELAVELWRAGVGSGDAGNESRAHLAFALFSTGKQSASVEQAHQVMARDQTTASAKLLFRALDRTIAKPDAAFGQEALFRGARGWISKVSRVAPGDLMHEMASSIGLPEAVNQSRPSCRPSSSFAPLRAC
jgi:tetratricopeptide (TPR) repeat protein